MKDIEICEYCLNAVTQMGDDGISVCEEGGCGIVEGHTKSITENEYEQIHG